MRPGGRPAGRETGGPNCRFVALQLGADAETIHAYADRQQTVSEHQSAHRLPRRGPAARPNPDPHRRSGPSKAVAHAWASVNGWIEACGCGVIGSLPNRGGFPPKAPVTSGRTSPLFDPTLGWSGRLCPVFRPVRTACPSVQARQAPQLLQPRRRHEARADQPVARQHRQPLAVGDIRLAPRYALDVSGIGNPDLHARRGQRSLHRLPEHPRTLHHHPLQVQTGQPASQPADAVPRHTCGTAASPTPRGRCRLRPAPCRSGSSCARRCPPPAAPCPAPPRDAGDPAPAAPSPAAPLPPPLPASSSVASFLPGCPHASGPRRCCRDAATPDGSGGEPPGDSSGHRGPGTFSSSASAAAGCRTHCGVRTEWLRPRCCTGSIEIAEKSTAYSATPCLQHDRHPVRLAFIPRGGVAAKRRNWIRPAGSARPWQSLCRKLGLERCKLLIAAERQKQRIVLLTHHVDVPRRFRDILWRHLGGQRDLDKVPLVVTADVLGGGGSTGGLQALSQHGRVPSRIIRRRSGTKSARGPPFRDRLLSRQRQMRMTARRAVRHQLFVSARLLVRCNSASARRRAASR